VSLLERGLPPARTAHLDKLARAFDIDVLTLLGLDSSPAATPVVPTPDAGARLRAALDNTTASDRRPRRESTSTATAGRRREA
jgi:hypothetical protein